MRLDSAANSVVLFEWIVVGDKECKDSEEWEVRGWSQVAKGQLSSVKIRTPLTTTIFSPP